MSARHPSRRDVLASALSALLAACGGGGSGKEAGRCPPPELNVTWETPADPELAATVARLLESSADDVFEVVTELLGRRSADDVLIAILHADVQAIEPISGGDLHAAMSIWACRHFLHTLPDDLRLVPVYYAARAMVFRVGRGSFALRPPATPRQVSPEAATRAFDEAMTAWDPEAADDALVSMTHNLTPEALSAHLLRWGPREMGDIGHAAIWFGLGLRTLDTIGWRYATPVFRSVVLDNNASRRSGLDAFYLEHLGRLQAESPRLNLCGTDDAVTRDVVQELRGAGREEASALAWDLLTSGAPVQSIWDGLAVSGAELMVRGGGGLALHRFDAMNALHHMFLRADDPLTRALILTQAVTWMGGWGFGARPDILALEPGEVGGVDEVMDATGRGPEAGARAVLGWFASGGDLEGLQASAEALAVIKAHRRDEHNYKFPVAVFEEAWRASPQWRPAVVAGLGGDTGRSPTSRRDDWPYLEEVLAQIDRLDAGEP